MLSDHIAYEWDYDRLRGMKVYSSDNTRIGTIDQVLRVVHERAENYLLVKSGGLVGILAQDELYIPESCVSIVGDDRVVLSLSHDEMQHPDWLRHPE